MILACLIQSETFSTLRFPAFYVEWSVSLSLRQGLGCVLSNKHLVSPGRGLPFLHNVTELLRADLYPPPIHASKP